MTGLEPVRLKVHDLANRRNTLLPHTYFKKNYNFFNKLILFSPERNRTFYFRLSDEHYTI